MKSHIYTSRKWYPPIKIKLLCSGEWVDAEEENEDIPHRSEGYKINDVHQWSIGAGHNATCEKCLIKHAERKMTTDNILMKKILEIAKGNNNAD